MKILGSIWFSPMQPDIHIGIVVVEYEEKRQVAYIGNAYGNDQKVDEKRIAQVGAKFNLKMAKELCGVKE